MARLALLLLLLGTALAAAAEPKAEFRAGVARANITPDKPIWMSGYAARTKPSEGILTDLFAKALAIEDRKKNKIVIVTTDLIGLPRAITDEIAARAEKEYGLRRAQLLFNASHTHTGPVVGANLTTMYFLDAAQKQRIQEYSRELTDDIVRIIGAALGDMTPVTLRFGQSEAGFAVNRRLPEKKGIRMAANPRGPSDHGVPVIEAVTADGRVKAILFGYACHNTTHSAKDVKFSGDYAAFAQAAVEDKHPGATALFLMLCGADQDPKAPRGTEEAARKNGGELAAAVETALGGTMTTLHAPLKAAYHTTELNFAPHTREQFEKEAQAGNKFEASRAREMLALYDGGHPRRSTPYPVQAVRFGRELTVLALGGEVVVDYALRFKRQYPKEKLVVAGYSNDVMCYIPSMRVLKEGGYEGATSMIYYGQPGPFAEDVEDRIWTAGRGVMKRVGARE